MARVIYCSACGRGIGSVSTPTHAELAEAAKGSPYAGMMKFVPANVAEIFTEVLVFACVTCSCIGGSDNGSEESNKGDSEESSTETEREKAGQLNVLVGLAEKSDGREREPGAGVGCSARGGR